MTTPLCDVLIRDQNSAIRSGCAARRKAFEAQGLAPGEKRHGLGTQPRQPIDPRSANQPTHLARANFSTRSAVIETLSAGLVTRAASSRARTA